jgi:hypothetical protein
LSFEGWDKALRSTIRTSFGLWVQEVTIMLALESRRGRSGNGRSHGMNARAGMVLVFAAFVSIVLCGSARPYVQLPPTDTVSGYVALLLINETPFPGERGWVSEADTKAAMLAILWVLESRLRHIPDGYRQEQVAAQRCNDIIDVITAGGEKGQCDGFYRNEAGEFVAVDRVHERVDYLVKCANRGEPGRFARMLEYAARLSTTYVKSGIGEADRFVALEKVGGQPVTGRAYSWMTDRDCYNPGGNFVRISDSDEGSMGGNRFFTLRKLR